MNLIELNAKKERLATAAKWGLAGLAALIVSPIIFLVIKGAIGLAVASIVGLAIVNFAPAVSMWFANQKLKAIKAEAARNPVETLQNVYAERLQKKNLFKQQITAFRAKVEGFAEKVQGFAESFPKDAPKFEQQLVAMRALLARRELKYKAVKSELEKFELVIQRADALWKMGLAAAEMNAAAGAFDGDQMMQRIKTETALESVTDSVNLAFSELESDLMEGDDIGDMPTTPQLTHQPSQVLGVYMSDQDQKIPTLKERSA